MRKPLFLIVFLVLGHSIAASGWGATFTFSTGAPNGQIGTASRPANIGLGQIEIETADDFILASQTTIDHATFTGLLPSGAPLSSVTQVIVEIYRVFPLDSANPPSGNVPTRVNSPSDVAFDSRDSAAANLTFTSSLLAPSFTVANSVVNGINKSPFQTTGGEGSVTGEEVLFDVTFTTPFTLPAGHYFFIPQVGLSSGNFLWLSAAAGTPFSPDLQSWIRNANLDPDWLRIGTDIVGGSPAPTFNGTFSLSGTIVVAAPPTITKAFGAASIALNGSTSLSFTITNSNPSTLTGIGVTDTLPAGLAVSNPNGFAGSCGGGAITAIAGSNSVTLSGASLVASGSCTFSVNVTGNTAGPQNNTTGAVTSNEGGTGGTASASVTVVAPALAVAIPTLQHWALWVLGLLILLVTPGVLLRRRKRN